MNVDRFPRVSTGNEPLDRILGGGFPAQSLNIIMGHPGTGKTVLAEQMLFHNAVADRPVLYLTTLSEPLGKVLTYLQRFDFFDEEKMGGGVVYEDIGTALASRGIGEIVDRVKAAIRDMGPRMIIIDSFKVIHDLEASTSHIRQVLSELAGVLAAYDTTTFLVGEYTEDQVPLYPEFAMADGVVHLMRTATGKADYRFLRVLKLRGSSYSEGLHAFDISPGGLQVFPRLVTPPVHEEYAPLLERVATGVRGLDELLGGGLWRGSASLVVGPEGSGKTTFGIGFSMAGVDAGEHVALLNFQEDPSQLARTLAAMGVGVRKAREKGLHLLYASPVELQIDSLVDRLFKVVEDNGVSRVVIDAAGDLALAAGDDDRFHDYLYSLIRHFASRRVTVILTLEQPPATTAGARAARARFASMTDVIIALDILFDGAARRTLRVVKARGIHHDLNPQEMEIHQRGLQLLGRG